MARPVAVKHNTFLKDKQIQLVDPVSNVYIIVSTVMGLDRLSMLSDIKFVYKLFIKLYVFGVNFAIVATTCLVYSDTMPGIIVYSDISQHLICVFVTILLHREVKTYFVEINKIDEKMGCSPPLAKRQVDVTIIGISALVAVMVGLYIMPYQKYELKDMYLQLLPLEMVHITELFFYGHLLNLVCRRLGLINSLLEASLSCKNGSDEAFSVQDKDLEHLKMYSFIEINKFIDVYRIIVNAVKVLNCAIKWQLLTIIITSFVSLLFYSYILTKSIIHDDVNFLVTFSNAGIIFVDILALVPPCLVCDRIQKQVHRMRTLLTSRLYEENLDKEERKKTRAFLQLTEECGISFTLMRMVDIDISLPLNFVGLLVTYLIIMLQFDKVINL